mmetsp:Transcript_16432/g.42440  ORF Transcript_16432/g.42440 Transcript_16432/m.42440 type:complete len:126 (-) Transcript_16432:59-436(-)
MGQQCTAACHKDPEFSEDPLGAAQAQVARGQREAERTWTSVQNQAGNPMKDLQASLTTQQAMAQAQAQSTWADAVKSWGKLQSNASSQATAFGTQVDRGLQDTRRKFEQEESGMCAGCRKNCPQQ